MYTILLSLFFLITSTFWGTIDIFANDSYLNASTISIGASHTCALTTGGVLYCWGLNTSGQLGDATNTNKNTPTLVAGGHTFSSISLGGTHTCALNTAGAAYCWGSNTFGQIGDGTNTNKNTPTLVAGGHTFSSISVGSSHTCALTTGGVVYCWGANTSRQIGDGTNTNRNSPTLTFGVDTFSSIAAGANHTCALNTAGAAYCWGSNTFGQIGDSSNSHRSIPTSIVGSYTFSSIAAGANHTCALSAVGVLYCWGFNSYGQIGDNTTINRNIPTLVSGGHTFSSVRIGANNTCALSAAGVAYCWGFNTFGQLGDGTNIDWNSPTLVAGGHTFSSISVGSEHTCALNTASLAYCWGLNSSGQLGDGTTTSRNTPIQVLRGQAPALTVTYKVSFHPNGATGAMSLQNFSTGTGQSLMGNSFTRTGYTFIGWNTADDGSGTGYLDQQVVVDLTGTQDDIIVLYAQWLTNQYTINFITNSGSSILPITNNYNDPITIPAPPTKIGYTFAGWLPALPGVMPANNITVNAQWIDSTSPILTLSGSGNISLTQGSIFIDPGAIWIDNSDGSGSVINPFSGSVNTSIPGNYILQYRYIDLSGNVSNIVTRNITIIPVSHTLLVGPGGGGGGVGGMAVSSSTTLSTPVTQTIPTTLLIPTLSNTQNILTPQIAPIINPIIPSIPTNLTELLQTQSFATPAGTNQSNQNIYTIENRVTDYVCPQVVKIYNEDELKVMDIPSGTFSDDIKSVIMFRAIESGEIIFSGSEKTTHYKNEGIASNTNLFEPNRNVTRAEYVKMLARALSCRYQKEGITTPFSDVDENMWYAEYINFAINHGWIDGFGDGTFRPNHPITRAEAAKILANAIKLQTQTLGTVRSSFSDVPETSLFAPYIEVLRTNNIISGRTSTSYRPNDYIPRTEVSRIIYRTFLGGNP